MVLRTTAPYKNPPHQFYTPKKSSTFKPLKDATWRIKYGDGGAASGPVGTDTIHLGGLDVENQAIGLAKELQSHFERHVVDGILGLAFGHSTFIKPDEVNSLVENTIAQANIPADRKVFTCYLGSWRDPNEAKPEESFFTFGYIDQDVLKLLGVQEPHYTPIDSSRGFWEFACPMATVGGKPIRRKDGNTAIVDTGTPLVLVSDDLCKHIYALIPGATYNPKHQAWTFPVNTPVEKLPTVLMSIGDKQFEIPKKELGFTQVSPAFQYGSIQSRGDSKTDILGDAWLRGIYAIFDQGNKRFGAVQRVEAPQNAEAPAPT